MYTASSSISKAMTYYTSSSSNRNKAIIKVLGRNKLAYYVGDQQYYRQYYLKSEHWKNLRKEKLKLNPICELCGSDNNVEPHHLEYRNLYDVMVSDLQTLCRRCHVKEHKRKIKPRTKKKFKIKNLFRHRKRLIRNVSKMGNLDRKKVEEFIDSI